jgi:hypothetical protein
MLIDISGVEAAAHADEEAGTRDVGAAVLGECRTETREQKRAPDDQLLRKGAPARHRISPPTERGTRQTQHSNETIGAV